MNNTNAILDTIQVEPYDWFFYRVIFSPTIAIDITIQRAHLEFRVAPETS